MIAKIRTEATQDIKSGVMELKNLPSPRNNSLTNNEIIKQQKTVKLYVESDKIPINKRYKTNPDIKRLTPSAIRIFFNKSIPFGEVISKSILFVFFELIPPKQK